MTVRFAIVGASGSGKTRLVTKLAAFFSRRGLRVGTIKHAHSGFEVDQRGKDSWRHYQAGARRVCVTGPRQTATFERGGRTLRALLPRFRDCDIVLVEGFRREGLPALEVYRRAVARRPLHSVEGFRVRGLVTRDPVEFRGRVFDPDSVAEIAALILPSLRAKTRSRRPRA
ncbi:MAG TPA: molybdopterin-guanine dinucleotide biosynthesis protein B [Planctomycetota bacterium]|nr:molybdopterin-guanine dinucleotide biosynthesis protein B [Planctomycetota bacterium]